ncbi:MAG: hypothetical protein IH612_02435 [Desulfofustis sp.]|nr:hypothetical protein [Desulfofustis sp.]
MIVSLLIAIAGVIVTAIQVALLHLQGSGICVDEGCQVVDSMTTVEPLYFNLAGLAFFLVVSFGLFRARRGSDHWRGFVSLLLLAALAGEGVLLSFQTEIAQVYCSYCLAILSLVALCNLFLGLKQLAKGVIVFGAVMLAFASLNFGAGQNGSTSLTDGTMARFEPGAETEHHYTLFFSSTCNHCETIIEELETNSRCAIAFNPVDTITTFSFPGVTFTPEYRPQINRDFLKKLDISAVPVLLSRETETVSIVSGEGAIRAFLKQHCSVIEPPQPPPLEIGQSSTQADLPIAPQDDGCSILSDCEPQQVSPIDSGETQSVP